MKKQTSGQSEETSQPENIFEPIAQLCEEVSSDHATKDDSVAIMLSYRNELLMCPSCGAAEKFKMTCSVVVDIVATINFSMAGEVVIKQSNPIECVACGHVATLADFQPKGST